MPRTSDQGRSRSTAHDRWKDKKKATRVKDGGVEKRTPNTYDPCSTSSSPNNNPSSTFPVKPLDPWYLDSKRRLRLGRDPQLSSQDSIRSTSSIDLAERPNIPSSSRGSSPPRYPRNSTPTNKKARAKKNKLKVHGIIDSPDPLILSQESVDAGIPSPVPSRLARNRITHSPPSARRVLVPSSSDPNLPVAQRRTKVKAARSKQDVHGVPSGSHHPMAIDEDVTPRPRTRTRRHRGFTEGETVEDEVKLQTPVLQEEDNDGWMFFKEMEKIDHQAMHKYLAENQPYLSSIDSASSPPLIPSTSPEMEETQSEKLDRDLRDLHAASSNPDDLCPYCSEAMPLEPSPHLLTLKERLAGVRAKLSPGRRIPWSRTMDFCSLHQAETSIIPKGIRAGYPTDIDFRKLPKRLEEKWIRAQIEELCRDPPRSLFFSRVIKDIKKKGKGRWAGFGHQSDQDIVDLTMPGYYGQLGRAIIDLHLQNLLQWKLLPDLSPRESGLSVIHPLTPLEFIQHVLVPEIAILLIMSDRGRTEYLDNTTANWNEAREEGSRIRERSVAFGRWKYRGEGEQAEKVLDDVQLCEEVTYSECFKRRRISKRKGSGSQRIKTFSTDEE